MIALAAVGECGGGGGKLAKPGATESPAVAAARVVRLQKLRCSGLICS